MILIITIVHILIFQCASSTYINIDVSKNDVLGWTQFDGIGAISGGGATSKLLMTYAEPFRSQILDYLFKPQFGASLHLLKVEIGGDSQSTEGTEASHSHYGWDLDCNRGYEWQLITEAKKRNPEILLYGLPWAFPGWVSNHTGNIYFDPVQLSYYIINWLSCARNTYNFEFQFIGIWNEKSYDILYIKTLRSILDKEGFPLVEIVAADGSWDISSDILKDPVLGSVVHAIGCHYPGTTSDSSAKQTGKKLWASEDYSTMNTDSGPYCWARILNQNFVNGNMTSTIAWNLVAAYYDALPYSRCGLMTAIEPWSGNYLVPSTIWVTAHTTQFSRPGWRYAPIGSGSGHLALGGSFVTLISEDLHDITMIFESMSHDKSSCIRPTLPPYTVKSQNVTININLSPLNKFGIFYLWRTDFSTKIFYQEGPIKPNYKGEITFVLPVDNLVTISTISSAKKGIYPNPPMSQPFPANYFDDFEKYTLSNEPALLTPQIGSFEVTTIPGTSKVVVQTVLDQPVQWCFNSPLNTKPIALIGNFSRSNVMLSISVLMPSWKYANSIFLGARINDSGCNTFMAKGVFFWLNFTSSEISISSDLGCQNVYVTQKYNLEYNRWFNMSMVLKDDNGWFYINEILQHEQVHLLDKSPPHGFSGLGTDKFGLAYFDNLLVKEI